MKAVALDFDGIIADTLQLNFEVKKAAFLPYGVELSLQEFIDYWVSPKPGIEGTPYYIKLKNLGIDPAESRRGQKEHFERLYREKVPLMPGALRLIQRLKAMGLPMAIVSSNFRPNVELVLKKFGLDGAFEFIIGFNDFSEKKPSPRPYRAAIERLAVDAGDVLAIEDSDTGVQSAKGAGCKVIAVPNRFTAQGDFSLADLVVKSLKEIDESVLSKF